MSASGNGLNLLLDLLPYRQAGARGAGAQVEGVIVVEKKRRWEGAMLYKTTGMMVPMPLGEKPCESRGQLRERAPRLEHCSGRDDATRMISPTPCDNVGGKTRTLYEEAKYSPK